MSGLFDGAGHVALWNMETAEGEGSESLASSALGRPPDTLGASPQSETVGGVSGYNLTDGAMAGYNHSSGLLLAAPSPSDDPIFLFCRNLSHVMSVAECVCQRRKCVTTMDIGCRNFEFVVSFVLVGVTCLFGCMGNVLSILTLHRDSVKSVTTFLLSALAVADFSFLVPAVFVIMIPTYCEFYQHCARSVIRIIPHFEQYGWAIASTTHSCTVYVTVLVAIHRYLWVCKPGLAEKLSGLGRAKLQVAVVPVGALIYNSPRFFEYQVRTYVYKSNNGTERRGETVKELTSVGDNTYFQYFYKNICFFIIMYLIPLAILVLVSVNLVRTLKQRRATLQRIGSASSATSQHRRDDNITFVLVIIIAAFVVCQTPTMLQRLLLAVAGDGGHSCGHPYFYLEHIADYMALLNSSTNFVIYILFSPHFRRTLISDVFCKNSHSQRTVVALKHLSRLSRAKKNTEEKNLAGQLGMAEDTSPGERGGHVTGNGRGGHVTGSGRTSHVTGSGRSSSQQLTNGQLATVEWLPAPPEPREKSGAGPNSHSTQVTTQEFLTLSNADDGGGHGVEVHRQTQTDLVFGSGESHTNSPDDTEIEVPLMSLRKSTSGENII